MKNTGIIQRILMTPADKIIYKTLSLLVMLSRSRKSTTPSLPDNERATLTISKQILFDAGLTVPEFANVLDKLNIKGYTCHTVIYDEYLRSQMNEVMENGQLKSALYEIEVLEKKEGFSDKFKTALKADLSKHLPLGEELDEEQIDTENISLNEVLSKGLSMIQNMRPDEISVVILLPFRDIEALHAKVGNGIKLDDIKDANLWYDPQKYEFHIDGDIVSTSYQYKSNIEHDVLFRMINDFDEGTIWYDDIENRSPRALKDALLKFIDKHNRLKEIFTVHQDRLEFSKEAFR
jgi:hypothetical protein